MAENEEGGKERQAAHTQAKLLRNKSKQKSGASLGRREGEYRLIKF